ncbi:glutathione S-transferase [Shigella sonnei]|uniref:glutathione binding-like protein n=1 Tax=Shigella sonnei TaxID=624 RepID=UPI000662D61A|nr:glutathione binding-like protein [Shigella sonnei]CSR62801.1 glutathione S-transferase [Shigella sonnei]CSS19377.1 glutathione S-transferase [Shigella sonnei]CSS27383.1 glutathione S-transferase [Shigella sonnei]CSS74546.1 glutathione S-transferase [Shigella sonnei]
MIDLYFAPTPNGHKITLFLEEAELDYRLIKVDLGKGGQFRPEFLRISPNNKIPAIVLTEKTGLFLSHETRERAATLQWLFWQVGGLGPMLGQNHHFNHAAPQTIPYAIERYQVETQRLYHVLNKRLENSPWLGGENYSIADIACWPWVNAWTRQRIDLAMYPAVKNWHERIRSRPATGQALLKAQLGDERSDS